MNNTISRNHLAVVAATVAAAIGGTAVAGAADSSSSSSETAVQRTADGPGPGGRHGGPGGPGRPGGHMGADLAAVAKKLGVTTAKLRSALDAARPTGEKPAREDFAAALAKELAGKVVTEADVRAALEKLGAAHEAEHKARHAAMYAAVAKALGKSEADVKAAFEAVKPKR